MSANRFQMACISGNLLEADAALLSMPMDDMGRRNFISMKFLALMDEGKLNPEILKHFLQKYFPTDGFGMYEKSFLLRACQKSGGELLIPILLDHFNRLIGFKFEAKYEAQYQGDNHFVYIREALNSGRYEALTALLQHPTTRELLKKSEFFFSVVIHTVVGSAFREYERSLPALSILLSLEGVEKVVIYQTTTKRLQDEYFRATDNKKVPESVLLTVLQKVVSDSGFTLEDNARLFGDAVKYKRTECANTLLLQADPKDKQYRDICFNIALENKDPITMERVLKKYPDDDFLRPDQMMAAFTIASKESPSLAQLLVQRKDKPLDLDCKTAMLELAVRKQDLPLATAVLDSIEDPAERRTAHYDLLRTMARLGHQALMEVLPKIAPPLNEGEAEALLNIARESQQPQQLEPPQEEQQQPQQLHPPQEAELQPQQLQAPQEQRQELQQEPQQLEPPQEQQQQPQQPEPSHEDLEQDLQALEQLQERLAQRLQQKPKEARQSLMTQEQLKQNLDELAEVEEKLQVQLQQKQESAQPTSSFKEAQKYLEFLEKVAKRVEHSFLAGLPRGREKSRQLKVVIQALKADLQKDVTLTKKDFYQREIFDPKTQCNITLESALKFRRFFSNASGLTKSALQVSRETEPDQLQTAVRKFLSTQCKRLKSDKTGQRELLQDFLNNEPSYDSIEALCASKNENGKTFLNVLKGPGGTSPTFKKFAKEFHLTDHLSEEQIGIINRS